MGQSAWRLRLRPGADRPGRARCALGRGSRPTETASVALGGVRAGGAARKLRHAVRLEFAVGLAEDPGARQCAAADHGMEAHGFWQRRPVRDLPAARNRARALPRRHAAIDAYRAAARLAAHGAGPGPRR